MGFGCFERFDAIGKVLGSDRVYTVGFRFGLEQVFDV